MKFQIPLLIYEEKQKYLTLFFIFITLNYLFYTHKNRTPAFFGSNYPPKLYSPSKIGQITISIEFSIFELVYKRSFILIRQFCLFGTNLPKNGIFGPKEKICTQQSNLAYSN